MAKRSAVLGPRYRWLVAAFAVVVALAAAPAAQAAFPSVYGGEVSCAADPSHGEVRVCGGPTHTWDGTKIDVNVFLPPETGGAEGPYPLIGDFHGWGGSKQGLTTIEPVPGLTFQQKDARIQHWAESGYAVFSMSDRGWGLSCGKYDAEINSAACEDGYNHLMDDRYEVRDAQYLISELADEGIAAPKEIGATGASYGGGISVALGVLRNREMLPDGSLTAWKSPGGKAMEIAAAAPQWAWTDLAYALAPNGRNLDYVTDSPYRGPSGKFPIGVMKFTYTEALYQAGLLLSNYSESDPEADIPAWRERLLGGEPYTDAGANGMIEQLSTFHSAFGINHAEAPAPLLLQSGWNDDLFPVDEALRLYQRTRAQFPGDPISLFLADYGHARSQNKSADVAAFNQRLEAWFAHYLKGEGGSPSSSVEALTTTCPPSAASEGPYTAADWSSLAPGEVRFQSSGARTIGHPRTATEEREAAENEEFNEASETFDPIFGPKKGKTVCSSVPDTDQPGSVNYRLAAAPAGGYTLMGSPTIVAKVESPSPNSEIAARLVDVAPGGTETLIARGLYRPVGGSQEVVFQLHPQGYHFAAGHVAKLELLPSDVPYGRWSNLQTNVTIDSLELRLPVMEQPGARGGLVGKPAPKVVPPGYQLAAEYKEPETGGGGAPPSPPPPPAIKIGAAGLTGGLTANRKVLFVPLRCTGEGACSGTIWVKARRPGKKGRVMLARGDYSIAPGAAKRARISLTKSGRANVKQRYKAKRRRAKTFQGVFRMNDSGRPDTLRLKRPVHLRGGH